MIFALVVPGEKHAEHSACPEDYPHTCVLVIVVRPWLPWPVFRECVHDTPGGDHCRIIHFLRVSVSINTQPRNHDHCREEQAIRDEGHAHNAVGVALAGMVVVAEAQHGDNVHSGLEEAALAKKHRHHFVGHWRESGGNPANPRVPELRCHACPLTNGPVHHHECVKKHEEPRRTARSPIFVPLGVWEPQHKGFHDGIHTCHRLDAHRGPEAVCQGVARTECRRHDQKCNRYKPVHEFQLQSFP